jgi:NAD(P)-dependent dehydrogenase (short-subunit alcohol dehydrogenase family)
VTTVNGSEVDRSAEVLGRLFDVRDVRAVVTGAASGAGLRDGRVLADCGARVTLADIDADLLEQSTSVLAERRGEVRCEVVDVSMPTGCRRLIDRVVAARWPRRRLRQRGHRRQPRLRRRRQQHIDSIEALGLEQGHRRQPRRHHVHHGGAAAAMASAQGSGGSS